MPRDPRLQIELIGHSNVSSLRRGVYVAISPPSGLTLAQATLLGLVVAGYDEGQIMAILHLGSLSAVKNRIMRVKDILGAADLPHLAVRALQHRIVIISEG